MKANHKTSICAFILRDQKQQSRPKKYRSNLVVYENGIPESRVKFAIRNGDVALLRAKLRGIDIEQRDEKGRTLLDFAPEVNCSSAVWKCLNQYREQQLENIQKKEEQKRMQKELEREEILAMEKERQRNEAKAQRMRYGETRNTWTG